MFGLKTFQNFSAPSLKVVVEASQGLEALPAREVALVLSDAQYSGPQYSDSQLRWWNDCLFYHVGRGLRDVQEAETA